MAAIPYDVAEAFVKGEHKRRGAFTSTGDAIHSYALNLARIVLDAEDGNVIRYVQIMHPLDDSHNISATTARHIRALAHVLTRECVGPTGAPLTAADLIRGAFVRVQR
ncbi:MAG: hypothetical protein M0Q49_05610 [Porticoccaceae bacterium]|nr:hypothetical protein [Porticoccaceae bacterium]